MRRPRTQAFRLALGFLATCLAAGGLVAQTRAEQEKQREQWQRVADIFRAMDVRPGAAVADVGAGDGFFTSRLASAVGPSGQVFAVDVSDAPLDRLRRRLTEQAITNVTVVKGTATDPRLPAGTLDAALIINAYHEMPEHRAMLEAIRSALKPTGRLVIVEPISASRRTATRADQTRDHEIGPEFVMQDVRAADLRIIGLEDPFTTRGRVVEWMMTVTPDGATAVIAANPPSAGPETGSCDWRDPGLRISVDEFVKVTSSGSGTIIDVRDEGMFAKGHIPNALLIPVDDVESSAGRLRGLKRPFLTYCS
jgi:predicted methyltransferase